METEMIRAAGAQPGGEWRFSVLDRACLNMVIKECGFFHGRLDAAAMKRVVRPAARILSAPVRQGNEGRLWRATIRVPFAVDEAPRCRLEQAVLMPDARNVPGHISTSAGFKRSAGAVEREGHTAGRRYRAEHSMVRMAAWTAMRSIRWCGAGCTAANRWCSPLRTILVAAARNPCLRRTSSQCEGGRMVSCRGAAALSRPSGLPRRVSAGAGRRPPCIGAR